MVVDGRMIANQPYFRLVEFSMDFSPQHVFGIPPKSCGTEAFHIGISHSTDTKNCGWRLSAEFMDNWPSSWRGGSIPIFFPKRSIDHPPPRSYQLAGEVLGVQNTIFSHQIQAVSQSLLLGDWKNGPVRSIVS